MRTNFKVKHYCKYKSLGRIYLNAHTMFYSIIGKEIRPCREYNIPQQYETPCIKKKTRKIKVGKEFFLTHQICISEYK